MQILFSVLMAVVMFVMVPRAAASAERIQEVLETEATLTDPEVPATLPALVTGVVVGAPTGAATTPARRGVVEFHDVEFRYPGAEDPVLRGISFRAVPGQTTAIVGSTGSGKSTLINLIPRFYDVTGGLVTIDGVDVRAMAQEDVWLVIGVIPQQAFLFSGTVASNLRYGAPEATDDDLWHALEVAQGRTFVEEMTDGLDAPITQGGKNVSGGQRQRLAIARALAKKPLVYIFDDSFSALDFKTDALLRAALEDETRNATVIIVAQRVGTIMQAYRIVVMDSRAPRDGRVNLFWRLGVRLARVRGSVAKVGRFVDVLQRDLTAPKAADEAEERRPLVRVVHGGADLVGHHARVVR